MACERRDFERREVPLHESNLPHPRLTSMSMIISFWYDWETEGSILTSRIDLSFLHWRERGRGRKFKDVHEQCTSSCAKGSALAKIHGRKRGELTLFKGFVGSHAAASPCEENDHRNRASSNHIEKIHGPQRIVIIYVIKCIFEKFVSRGHHHIIIYTSNIYI